MASDAAILSTSSHNDTTGRTKQTVDDNPMIEKLGEEDGTTVTTTDQSFALAHDTLSSPTSSAAETPPSTSGVSKTVSPTQGSENQTQQLSQHDQQRDANGDSVPASTLPHQQSLPPLVPPPPLPLDKLSIPPEFKEMIHSAKPSANDGSNTSAAPRATIPAPTQTKKKFSVFSPSESPGGSPKRAQSLRRIFSPLAIRENDNVVSDAEPNANMQLVATTNEDTLADNTTPLRRRRLFDYICGCLGRTSQVDDLTELEYGNHLKNIRPTFEPDSPLLPDASPHVADRICLVLDLDETLVHSSFTPIPGADFEIPLNMHGDVHTVYVKKRPGVDHFLRQASEWYEIVVFTASLALYANPVMDLLDPHKLVQMRLYREHCVLVGGCYVKDIAKLGRDLRRTFIIDNSPLSYVLQPENAIPISAFFTDDNDRELEKTLAILEQSRHLKDVRRPLLG